MKKSEPKCAQQINGRPCTHNAQIGAYCHQHHDQSLHARVGRRCNMSAAKVSEVAAALIDEMGWPEIKAFHAEHSGQSVHEDAGGYMLRKIGRLFGVKPRNEVETYRTAMQRMLRKGNEL